MTRDQEYAADLNGMQYALAAGYSTKGVRAYQKLGEINSYSSFEALSADHPSANDRLARLDRDQASLWRSMSAFDNGVFFLKIEQYESAKTCFRNVVRAFPDADEAWANLGYALLMQYADSLEPDDVRRFDIGQLMVAGFYTRPKTLQGKVRRIDMDV